MAIQDIPVTSRSDLTGSVGAPAVGDHAPETRLFQDGLNHSRQRLAQAVIAPVAPVAPPVTPGTPITPVPVLPGPGLFTQPGKSTPPDYGLTPYEPPPMPSLPVRLQPQPGTENQAGSQVRGQIQHTIPGNQINIPHWNNALAAISSTLQLKYLSPAKQLQINRQGDRNIHLQTQYALGLQSPLGGKPLALVGSLQELFGFLSVPKNANLLEGLHTHSDGLSVSGLQQRYTQAVDTKTTEQALNHTRALLKYLQTHAPSGQQSFAALYPTLSLSTVADRSAVLQNGFKVNQQSNARGAGLKEPYVFGFKHPVIFNNGKTRNIAVNLTGSLDALGPFIKAGGYGWLAANGLIPDQSSGLTTEGLVYKYEQAKTTFDPNQRSPQQTGGDAGRQLVQGVELGPPDDSESTVNTKLPYGAERESMVSVKTDTNDNKRKNDSGLIGVRSVTAPQLQPPENANNSEPIRASAADADKSDAVPYDDEAVLTLGNNEFEQEQIENIWTVRKEEITDHFAKVHLLLFDWVPKGFEPARLFDSPIDVLKAIYMDGVIIETDAYGGRRELSDLEKKIIANNLLDKVAYRMLATFRKDIYFSKERYLEEVASALNHFQYYVMSGHLSYGNMNIYDESEIFRADKNNNATCCNYLNRLQYEVFVKIFEPYASKDPDSYFQGLIEKLAEMRQQDRDPEVYDMLYKVTKEIMRKTIEIVFEGQYTPNYIERSKLKEFYEKSIAPRVFGGSDNIEYRNGSFQLLQKDKQSIPLKLEELPLYLPFGKILKQAYIDIKRYFPVEYNTDNTLQQLLQGLVNIIANEYSLSHYEIKKKLNSTFSTLNITDIKKYARGLLAKAAFNLSKRLDKFGSVGIGRRADTLSTDIAESEASQLINYFNLHADAENLHAVEEAYNELTFTAKLRYEIMLYQFFYDFAKQAGAVNFTGISTLGIFLRQFGIDGWKIDGVSVYEAVKTDLQKALDKMIAEKNKEQPGLEEYYQKLTGN